MAVVALSSSRMRSSLRLLLLCAPNSAVEPSAEVEVWARINKPLGQFALFALALGPRYLPTTRLTTMAAMPASTALAIGDDRMSEIGLDPDACC